MHQCEKDQAETPQVVLRRRPNDFSQQGVVLLQIGCCCCCCCCLHWIGAAGGAIWGTVAGCRTGTKPASNAEALARGYVYWGTFFGALFWAPLLICTGLASAQGQFGEDIYIGLLIALAFAPSVAVLTMGAGALLGACLGVAVGTHKTGGYLSQGATRAWGLAWRIAWKTFLYATCGSGLGYLAMYLIYVIAEALN